MRTFPMLLIIPSISSRLGGVYFIINCKRLNTKILYVLLYFYINAQNLTFKLVKNRKVVIRNQNLSSCWSQ